MVAGNANTTTDMQNLKYPPKLLKKEVFVSFRIDQDPQTSVNWAATAPWGQMTMLSLFTMEPQQGGGISLIGTNNGNVFSTTDLFHIVSQANKFNVEIGINFGSASTSLQTWAEYLDAGKNAGAITNAAIVALFKRYPFLRRIDVDIESNGAGITKTLLTNALIALRTAINTYDSTIGLTVYVTSRDFGVQYDLNRYLSSDIGMRYVIVGAIDMHSNGSKGAIPCDQWSIDSASSSRCQQDSLYGYNTGAGGAGNNPSFGAGIGDPWTTNSGIAYNKMILQVPLYPSQWNITSNLPSTRYAAISGGARESTPSWRQFNYYVDNIDGTQISLTGTGAKTTWTASDNTWIGGITKRVKVYVNATLKSYNTDYTITEGTNIVFGAAPANGANIQIIDPNVTYQVGIQLIAPGGKTTWTAASDNVNIANLLTTWTVKKNGATLTGGGVDYTTTNNTQIVFVATPAANDKLELIPPSLPSTLTTSTHPRIRSVTTQTQVWLNGTLLTKGNQYDITGTPPTATIDFTAGSSPHGALAQGDKVVLLNVATDSVFQNKYSWWYDGTNWHIIFHHDQTTAQQRNTQMNTLGTAGIAYYATPSVTSQSNIAILGNSTTGYDFDELYPAAVNATFT